MLGPILWDIIFELTWDYQADCNQYIYKTEASDLFTIFYVSIFF